MSGGATGGGLPSAGSGGPPSAGSGGPPTVASGPPIVGSGARPVVGVLALQGDVREHSAALRDVGAQPMPVRRPGDLQGIQGLVLPGGESSTLSMLIESAGIFDPLSAALRAGLPALGTCAGLLLLADEVRGGRPDQRSLHAVRCVARRNAYGRQVESFEAALDAHRLDALLSSMDVVAPEAGTSMLAVCIRAPIIEAVGPEVEVIVASPPGPGVSGGTPMACRQGNVVVTTFHPELTMDRRVHRLFVSLVVRGAAPGAPAQAAAGLAPAQAAAPSMSAHVAAEAR